MIHTQTLSCLESANEFVTMQGFDPITDHVLNPDNRYLSYNERGQMCMARTYLNYQEIGNVVIEVKIAE